MKKNELVDFENWLRKERQTARGDPLLPRTIEQYLYYIKDAPSAQGLDENKTVEILQRYVDSRKAKVVLVACRNYMEFLGFERLSCLKLVKKKPQRTALRSIPFWIIA